MNYFIGITPPHETAEKIASFQKKFKNNKLPYFFEQHITIKTKNGLTEDGDWINVVRPVIENYPKFKVHFKGIENFGDRVVVLKPHHSENLITLHKALYQAIKPDETDPTRKFFENENFEAHFTLGMETWGMTKAELTDLKEQATKELTNLPSFEVSFLRIYQQSKFDEPYNKLLDIPLYDN